jgi:hypothetical protein
MLKVAAWHYSLTSPACHPVAYATNILQDGTGAYTDGTGGANWDNASLMGVATFSLRSNGGCVRS